MSKLYRLNLCLILAFVSLIVPSCKKKAPAQSVGDEGQVGQGLSETGDLAGYSGPVTSAFIIRGVAGFWSLKDGAMKWEENLSIGQELRISGQTVKGSYETRSYDILPVELEEGKSGYVIANQAAVDCSLGVVTSTLASVYKSPKDVAITETILPPLNIVGLRQVGENPDFYQFTGYGLGNQRLYTDMYLAAADVSTSPDDVNAAILLNAIKEKKKIEQKQKLVATLKKKYSTSAFAPIIQEIELALEPEKLGLEDAGSTMECSQESVVFDIPSVYGVELGRVKAGESAQAEKRSSSLYKVDGKDGFWVKIGAPISGWVFSSDYNL